MASEIFRCNICPKSYNVQSELNRHQKRHSKPFRCENCSRGFALRSDLERHIKARHRVGNDQHRCLVDQCRKTFKRKDNLMRHVRKVHPSALPSAKSNNSMADATTTDALPQNVALSAAVHSFNGIGSVAMFMQAATSGNIALLKLLMNSKFTMETRANDGSTVLHCAARAGQAETVQYLLDEGADVHALNNSYRIPLYEGFLSNDLDTVKVLIEQMSEKDLQSRTWIGYYLAQTKNIKVFELYTQCSKVRLGPDTANELLKHAIFARNDTLAAALLDRPDVDVNGHNMGYAPILEAARHGNKMTMKLLLASRSVNKSVTTKLNKLNALHIAASNGHANIVQQLLNLKFDVGFLDAHRCTPLHHAAMRGHFETIKLLVDKWNADVSFSDLHGYTPLLHAVFKGHWKCVHVLLEYIDSKSHDDSMDIQTGTIEFVKKDVITRVLKSAAFENRNISYRSSNNLLHFAVQNRDFEALEVLLSYDDIDVNAKNDIRQSPLFIAVEKHWIEAVRLLLQHPQIDVNQKRWGNTALSWAKSYKYQEIVDLLLLHGAVDDQGGNAPTITTEDSSSLTTVKPGHMHNTSLQSEHEIDPGFDFDTFMEGVPALDDISDAEDEMMGQEFS